jgi:16S rRNA processing protein RimM
MAEPHWVPLGKIGRTQGLRGALRVHPYGQTLATRKPGDGLFLCPSDGSPVKLTLTTLRQHGRVCIVQFTAIDSAEAARSLTGKEVFLPEDLLPPTEDGEYYYYQLLGLRVETPDGVFLGTICEVLPTGANDIYIVRHAGKEILIPAIADVIVTIDLKLGRMVVDLPEGLTDDL